MPPRDRCRLARAHSGTSGGEVPSRVTAIALLLVLQGAWPAPASAAERSILLLTPTAADARLDASHEAIGFWNEILAGVGVETRLAEPQIVVESSVARALENYARRIATRAGRLPAGDFEPAPPEALTRLDADIVVLLSRQDIMSFTWPLPRVDPPRYFVVIRSVRGPDRGDAMVTRHVVAHELGHAIGARPQRRPARAHVRFMPAADGRLRCHRVPAPD